MKLATKIGGGPKLGGERMLRDPEGDRLPDRHLKPAATRGTRIVSGMRLPSLPLVLTFSLPALLGAPPLADERRPAAGVRGTPVPVNMTRRGENLMLAFSLPANLGTGPTADERRPAAGVRGKPRPA